MFAHLDPGAVIVTRDSMDKEEALTRLVTLSCRVFGISDPGTILAGVVDRESKLSTGIGLEVAVPHCRTSQVRHVVMAAMLARSGIEYNSIDGLPVKLVFLILSPENDITGHLATLSSISHAVSDESIRSSLLEAPDTASLFRGIETIH